MARSLRIGRIAGTPISVNGGLAVLATVFVVSLALQGFPQLDGDAGLTSRFLVASATVTGFLLSILAHELGHATVAKNHGVGVLGITLSLLGGYAQLDRQAPNPRAEFSIAAAGPAVNLLIGAVLGGVTYVLYLTESAGNLVLGAVGWLAGVNVVLAVLNLFPAAPFDGGRVLTAALWKRLRDAEQARVISGRIGLILGVTMTLAGAVQLIFASQWQGLITLIVGVFLFNGARGEIGAATIRRRLQRTMTRDLMINDPPPVADSLTVEQLNDFAGADRSGIAFPVVRWTADPIGYVAPSAGRSLHGLDRARTTVRDLMQPTPEVARAWVTEPIDTVLQRLGDPKDLLVVVHEPTQGRVVGTISDPQLEPLLEPPDIWGRNRRAGGAGTAAGARLMAGFPGSWRRREQPVPASGSDLP